MPVQLARQPLRIERITACAFRRPSAQKRFVFQRCKQRQRDLAACRPNAVFVKRLACVLLAPEVHQSVAGAAIKTEHRAIRLQHRQIGNTAHIEHPHGAVQLCKHGLVKGRSQRCALPACCHVATAKISRHVDACKLGQQGRVVQLQGVARAVIRTGAVPHCLAMSTNSHHTRERHAGLRQERLCDLRVKACQGVGGKGCAVQFVVARSVQRKQICSQFRSKRTPVVADYPRFWFRKVGQNAVHTIQRGARH